MLDENALKSAGGPFDHSEIIWSLLGHYCPRRQFFDEFSFEQQSLTFRGSQRLILESTSIDFCSPTKKIGRIVSEWEWNVNGKLN